MTTQILQPESNLSLDEIEAVEREFGIRLPDEYKLFLLKFNGGKPVPDMFVFATRRGAYSDSCVDWFLSIYDGEYSNFRTYFHRYKIHRKRIPHSFVPIANDPGGNLICLSVEGDDRGSVYFWDHESESDTPEDCRNVNLIASSFQTFLDGLKEFEPTEK